MVEGPTPRSTCDPLTGNVLILAGAPMAFPTYSSADNCTWAPPSQENLAWGRHGSDGISQYSTTTGHKVGGFQFQPQEGVRDGVSRPFLSTVLQEF
jgi:hypothetical protein